MDFHIRGFGACMIGGYPHRQEDSFLHLAVERLRRETKHHIVDSLFTMGGFPVTRVPKHLEARCLAARPDIVVLQFGSSDLIVPVRRRYLHSSNSSVHHKVSARPPDMLDLFKWRLLSVIGTSFKMSPVTAPEIYLATMKQLVQMLLEHKVTPVVMSPFVFGARCSDRIAHDCAVQLEASLSAFPKAIYVDAYAALHHQPRRRMLLRDGSHLSLAGQQVVADALFPALKNLLGN